MSLTGQWLCYLPRAFARRRDYQVLCGAGALTAHLTDAFTVVAEGMLRAQGNGREPTWEYVPLDEEGFVVLCRCAWGLREGVEAPVVWALLLPPDFVLSRHFGLSDLPGRFPGAELDTEPPAPPDLTRSAPTHPTPAAFPALLAHYLEAGTLTVNLDSPQALRLFTTLVEALAPRDRLEVSFATVPGSNRALTVDRTAAPPQQAAAVADAVASLELWSLARARLGEEEQQSASLRDPAGWLCALLPAQKLRASYASLVKEVRAKLAPALHPAALGYLRQSLERRLSQLPAPQAGRVLAGLAEDQLLSSELGVPPMWLARVVLEVNCLEHLSPALLERLLQPDMLPMIIESVQRPSSLARLMSLAAALEVAPRPRDPLRLRDSCASVRRALLHQGVSLTTLARAVAVAVLLDPYTARDSGTARSA